MIIKYIDEFTIDIYLKKEIIKNIDINNRTNLEKYLKELFIILKDYYNLEILGFYNITIFNDKYYGIILHLKKENIDYYNYFNSEVDMHLLVINTEFLYLVNDIPIDIKEKVDIVIKNSNIYLKIIDKLSNLEMMKLLENSQIIYK